MADVTISALTPGTPAGNSILPYSTGAVTLSVPVSAIFQNTSNVGINTTNVPSTLTVNGDMHLLAYGKLNFSNTAGTSYINAPLSNHLALYTTGVQRMTIDSSGNVGIGNASPDGKLHIMTASAGSVTADVDADDLTIEGSGNTGLSILASGDDACSIYFGNPGTLGQKDGGIRYYQENYVTAGDRRSMAFITGTIERLRIDSSGNVLVGTADASATQGVGIKNAVSSANPSISIVANTSSNDSNLRYYNTNATYSGYRFYITTNGGIINYSANNVNLSDERLKTNINLAGNYLEKICLIPVKTFIYKDQGDDTERTIGVLAQEVEAVIPELINNDGFGETPADGIPLKTIYQTDLQYVLMRCIQEIVAKIGAMESRLTVMESGRHN